MSVSMIRSTARIFSSISARPRVCRYASSVTPSNWRYTSCRPASSHRLAKSASRANRRPFVAIWVWENPMSMAARRQSRNRGCSVGSPPENWMARPGAGRVARYVRSIARTCSKVGSYT